MKPTITLRFEDGDKTVTAERIISIHGFDCAVHRHYLHHLSTKAVDREWCVSEITTGMKVCMGDTPDEAAAVAKDIEKRRPKAEWKTAITKGRAIITRRNKRLAKQKDVA